MTGTSDAAMRMSGPTRADKSAGAGRRSAVTALAGLLAGAVLFGSPGAQADCMRDRTGRVVCDAGQCARDIHGAVRCSRFEDGAAVRNRYGEVLCGKGDCVTTRTGDIICSSMPRGAAMKDSRGDVTCFGGCERASAVFCGPTDNATP